MKKVLTQQSVDKKKYIVRVVENNYLSYKKESILTLPTKLPIIVKPKPYTKDKVGGYLLNDVKFSENLFIEKKGYGINSELSDNTKIYDMINNISNTPFKINNTLMNFILNNGDKYNLLIDPFIEHKFSGLTKKSKY